MKLGKISTSQLLSTKRNSLGLLALGVYFIFVTLLIGGVINYPNIIMGLTFIACALITAHDKPLVLSGILVGFMGMANLLSIANVFPIDTAWIITGLCALAVFVLEFSDLKIGPASQEAKDAVVVPMLALFFMFVLAIAGYNPALYVDLGAQPLKFINYLLLMLFTGLLTFQYLGWKLLKKNQELYIAILAVVCAITSFIGVWQGTLAW